MNVPLDNLYHWVESLLPAPAIVYVFRPHGSKKISNCDWLKNYNKDTGWKFPSIIMHDQEPLDWEFYNCPDQYIEYWKKRNSFLINNNFYNDIRIKYLSNFNLKSLSLGRSTVYDQIILIHSEKNSTDLEKYQQNGFICVHYWAHAVIARDWYRFAEHDIRLHTGIKSQNKFLIYCRDWSHRREYRLKFLELLEQNDLSRVSQTSVMHTNSDNVHFSDYKFLNSEFKLHDPDLIYQIPNNTFSSTSSADYDYQDFINAEISVILETVFDDNCIHLTEKTLRPIACGHPFILAGGPGSLEYIRSYGFKTFEPWIDESYDQETNSLQRLKKIIASMNQIKNLQGQQLEEFLTAIRSIAEFNKQHFFSKDFINIVTTELQNNLNCAYSLVRNTRGKHYLEIAKLLKRGHLTNLVPQRQEKTLFLRQLRQSYPSDPSRNPEDPVV